MEMFYGFNHPVYQEIDYRGLLNKVCYPKEISDIRNNNLTLQSRIQRLKTKISTQKQNIPYLKHRIIKTYAFL